MSGCEKGIFTLGINATRRSWIVEMSVYDVDAEMRARNDQFFSLQRKCLLSFRELSLKNMMRVEPDASKYLQVASFFFTPLSGAFALT